MGLYDVRCASPIPYWHEDDTVGHRRPSSTGSLGLTNLTNLTNLPQARPMARQINLYEAKTNLSRLVDEAAKGEDIVVAKNGKAMVRLTAIAAAATPEKRKFGQWAHLLTPEELEDFGSPSWWQRWKEADAEIERDFERSAEDRKEFESRWPDSSSTPTSSSGQKKIPVGSKKKRSKKSGRRRTGSL
jgi:prevent-host-death family protein